MLIDIKNTVNGWVKNTTVRCKFTHAHLLLHKLSIAYNFTTPNYVKAIKKNPL